MANAASNFSFCVPAVLCAFSTKMFIKWYRPHIATLYPAIGLVVSAQVLTANHKALACILLHNAGLIRHMTATMYHFWWSKVLIEDISAHRC